MKIYRGITLFELLIGLGVAAILFGIGAPSFEKIIQKNQATSAMHTIYRHYQAARQSAISQQKTMMLCGSDSGSSCDKVWSKYIILFDDSDNDKEPSATEIIQIHQLKLGQSYIKTRMAFGLAYTQLAADGSAKFTGSMIYCPQNKAANLYRRVTWNRVGRPYFGRDMDKDGIVDDTDGKPLDCD